MDQLKRFHIVCSLLSNAQFILKQNSLKLQGSFRWIEQCDIILKTDRKWMSLYKLPLFNLFWSFLCQMHVHLSKNWGSDGHFEVLNRSYYHVKTVSKRMTLYKWPLYNLFWPFFCHICVYLHKTDFLTVILRCLTGLI